MLQLPRMSHHQCFPAAFWRRDDLSKSSPGVHGQKRCIQSWGCFEDCSPLPQPPSLAGELLQHAEGKAQSPVGHHQLHRDTGEHKHATKRHCRPFPRTLEGLIPVSASLQSARHAEARAIVTNALAKWHKEAADVSWSPHGSAESTCSFSSRKKLFQAKSSCTHSP